MDKSIFQALIPDEQGILRPTVLTRPPLGPKQLWVSVKAAGVNRADLMQRAGKYPPPPGDSPILGLELAGLVEACGSAVTYFKPGDRIFALVGGGGYATHCVVEEGLTSPLPDDWTYAYGASIPEVFYTADETVFTLGQLAENQSLLLHAALSGVGTAILQMAQAKGVKVYATVGSLEKQSVAKSMGAEAVFNYKEGDFLPWILEETGGEGVDLVQDFIGKSYFERNLKALKSGGRLLQVATMSGAEVQLDLRLLMRKRLQLIGSVMRSRSLFEKIKIKETFWQRWGAYLLAGDIKPIIDSFYPWTAVEEAHQRMQANLNIGKIILLMD